MEETSFRNGDFLRSEKSALGLTMNQYIGEKKENIDVKRENIHYIAYNDHVWDFKAKGKKFINKEFYENGAHEKGFIGFKKTKDDQWSGAFIQHSLQKFPVPILKNEIRKIVPPLPFNTDLTQSQHVYYALGWGKYGFFPQNLLPYRRLKNLKTYFMSSKTINVKEKILDDDMEEIEDEKDESEINEDESIIVTKDLSTTPSMQIINSHGINVASMPFTLDIKPSQHALCVSIDSGKKIVDLLKFLSNLSNGGLMTNLYDANFVEALKKLGVDNLSIKFNKNFQSQRKDNDGMFLEPTDIFDPKNTAHVAYKKSILRRKLTFSTIDYYMVMNTAKHNHNDIWKSLIFCNPKNEEPCLRNEKDGKLQKGFHVSTWVTKKKDIWYENVFESGYQFYSQIKLLGKPLNVFWKPNTQEEHSKIAFKSKENSYDEKWNVCVSGGNLYGKRGTSIKSSLMMCFKHKPLNQALLQLKRNIKYEEAKDKNGNSVEAKVQENLEEFTKKVAPEAKTRFLIDGKGISKVIKGYNFHKSLVPISTTEVASKRLEAPKGKYGRSLSVVSNTLSFIPIELWPLNPDKQDYNLFNYDPTYLGVDSVMKTRKRSLDQQQDNREDKKLKTENGKVGIKKNEKSKKNEDIFKATVTKMRKVFPDKVLKQLKTKDWINSMDKYYL
ncbi:hypothetical protein CYY_008498 [Polysphondylium violaceum]|uniref:Uncharacterized protein n=1 Tax=Polysphondylium violaceum TaxID=133409 RepID=A0A8J4UX90_9MYCE|nr:hypothetical protein CYY_008498 [Polysphondylium violaceum]